MDCNMPIMDGFEATERISQLPFVGKDSIMIVASTANTSNSYKVKCLEAGMHDFLSKPITSQKLKEILKKASILPII